MKLLQTVIKKLDRGESDLSTGLELATGALLLAVALRWMSF